MGKIILDKIIERVFNSELKDATKKFVKINKNYTFDHPKAFLRELTFSGWEIFSIIKGSLIVFYLTFIYSLTNKNW